ncbi:Ig-like domain-containing protein [Cellulomonas sp. NPDC089187]|uniref:Ig-like domain-containing protein n=1 Tax=Cellulomonas sp. NPDC089187 TaxID=3154970 RepID=UPI00344112C9
MSTATVTVQVIALTVDDVTAETGYGTAVTVDVVGGASGHGVTASQVGEPSHGTAVLNVVATVTYTPAAGFSGTDSFTVTVIDDLGQMATATVTVTVGQEPPGGSEEPTPTPTTGPPAHPTSGVLAVTGQQAGGVALLAFAVVTTGWWLVRWSRRRHQRSTD